MVLSFTEKNLIFTGITISTCIGKPYVLEYVMESISVSQLSRDAASHLPFLNFWLV